MKTKAKFVEGSTYRSYDLFHGVDRAGLQPYRFKVVDRREGFRSPLGNVLPRVAVEFVAPRSKFKQRFYNLPVRTVGGVEYVDIRDIDTRVVAKVL